MREVNDKTTGRVIVLPEEQEEAAINRGIIADPDTCELTDGESKQLRSL